MLCDMSVPDDEYHIIMVCPAFCYGRAELMPRSFVENPTLDKFKAIVNSKEKKTLLMLTNFMEFIESLNFM